MKSTQGAFSQRADFSRIINQQTSNASAYAEGLFAVSVAISNNIAINTVINTPVTINAPVTINLGHWQNPYH